MARREKKPVHHVQMTDGKRAIIQQLLQEYDIETAEDIQNALKDLKGLTVRNKQIIGTEQNVNRLIPANTAVSHGRNSIQNI